MTYLYRLSPWLLIALLLGAPPVLANGKSRAAGHTHAAVRAVQAAHGSSAARTPAAQTPTPASTPGARPHGKGSHASAAPQPVDPQTLRNVW